MSETEARSTVAACVLLLSVAACGSSNPAGTATSGSDQARMAFGDCASDDPAITNVEPVGIADVNGDGTPDALGLSSPEIGEPCGNALVADLGESRTGIPLGEANLVAGGAAAIQLHGTDRQLLVALEKPHPRGGHMVHLYGTADGQLGEVLAGGQPVVGFVATDGGASPATARCTADGGLETLSATPHEPPGVVLAWDVTRTTYSLNGNAAEETSTTLIREAAADRTLRKEMAQLFDPDGYFADCLTR